MKIENDFDIISKICESEQGIDVKKRALRNLKISAFTYSIFTAVDIATNSFNPASQLVSYAMCNSLMNIFDLCVYGGLMKNNIKALSHAELHFLVQKLQAINVNTSVEMLKEAEVSEVNYKLIINEKKIPVLRQNKYILIPTYSDYKIDSNESILQEHDMGSHKWILSVGSPKKLTKTRLAFNP